MRTIALYNYSELSEEAKKVAIESVRNSDDFGVDFGHWAVDDCSLFEPKNEEMVNLFGDKYNFPLIENTREKIYFDTDRNSFLDIAKAIKITDHEQFLNWLGINKELQNKTSYNIYTPQGRNSDTTLEFHWLEKISSTEKIILDKAVNKFDNHIKDILKRIKADIDYRYTDDSVAEDIEANEDAYEFYENGKLHK